MPYACSSGWVLVGCCFGAAWMPPRCFFGARIFKRTLRRFNAAEPTRVCTMRRLHLRHERDVRNA
eukprot:2030521-Lingulodinium_polyedra.AAC.1